MDRKIEFIKTFRYVRNCYADYLYPFRELANCVWQLLEYADGIMPKSELAGKLRNWPSFCFGRNVCAHYFLPSNENSNWGGC